MENYEWNTIEGRFNAARKVVKLDQEGKTEEAEKLRELLREATAVYGPPEYYVLADKKNKQIILLYGKTECFDDNEFDKFIRNHIDNYICHVKTGCTWLSGMICQQCEPTITAKRFEKWNVFETDDGQLWFEQM